MALKEEEEGNNQQYINVVMTDEVDRQLKLRKNVDSDNGDSEDTPTLISSG